MVPILVRFCAEEQDEMMLLLNRATLLGVLLSVLLDDVYSNPEKSTDEVTRMRRQRRASTSSTPVDRRGGRAERQPPYKDFYEFW